MQDKESARPIALNDDDQEMKRLQDSDFLSDEIPASDDMTAENDSAVDNNIDDAEESEALVDDASENDESEENKTYADTVKTIDLESKQHKKLKDKIEDGLRAWWNNKKLRYGTFAAVAVVVLLIGIVPPSRYYVLNSIGIRSKASIVVLDDQTEKPLKNVQVAIGDQVTKTNIDGKAQLSNLKLGKQPIKIQKRAYAESVKTVTIGWGSNPLGNSQIKAVGTQFTFEITDWLSGKPISRVEATAGEFDANSDEKGLLTLVVDAKEADNLNVVFKVAGYRDEKVIPDDEKDTQQVKLVSSRKHPFISKRSGNYDLYKIDSDGKNEKLVLPGTGNENESIGLVTHPNLEITALTSARDNQRNKQGYLLTTLSIVDLKDDSVIGIAQSEQIQIIGWSGDNLVYVTIAEGASAANPKRQRMFSYNYKTEDKTELTSSNNFNDVLMVKDTVYYTTSGINPGFYEQKVNSKNRKSLLDKDTWNIFRSTYDTLDVSAGDEWYQLRIGESNVKKQANQPSSQKSRMYSDSSDGERSLWVDERDGKGTLVLYDTATKKDKVLATSAGIENPVRWLNNNTLVYRIRTQQESADYVLNIDGGGAKKIRDVTATFGVERWYH